MRTFACLGVARRSEQRFARGESTRWKKRLPNSASGPTQWPRIARKSEGKCRGRISGEAEVEWRDKDIKTGKS